MRVGKHTARASKERSLRYFDGGTIRSLVRQSQKNGQSSRQSPDFWENARFDANPTAIYAIFFATIHELQRITASIFDVAPSLNSSHFRLHSDHHSNSFDFDSWSRLSDLWGVLKTEKSPQVAA